MHLHPLTLAALALLLTLTTPGGPVVPTTQAQAVKQGVFAKVEAPNNAFALSDNTPLELSISLLDNPGTASPAIFLEADGVRFTTCRLDFNGQNWNVPQKVTLVPKASFEPADGKSIFGMRLGWKDDPKQRHAATQSVEFTRNVSPGATCTTSGDPHLVSFDKRRFDYMGMNCYTLLKSENLVVQVRQASWFWGKPAVAINVGLAIASGKAMWRVDPFPATNDARVQRLSPPEADDLHVTVSANGTDVRFRTADGAIVKVTMVTPGTPNAYLGIEVVLSACYKSQPGQPNKTGGLCGTYDANVDNDFLMRDGQPTQDPTAFGNSWKLLPEEDMFVKGYESTVKATLKPMLATNQCTLPDPNVVDATGITPEPPGYQEVVPPPNAVAAAITPLPPPPAEPPVTKERRDPAWTAFVTDLCKKALTLNGLDKMKNIPTMDNHLKSCVEDCQLGGTVETIDSFRVAYQREVHTRLSEELERFQICKATGKPRPRTAAELTKFSSELGLDNFKCPGGNCNGRGDCLTFGCQCQAGWTVFDCSFDLKAKEKEFLDNEAAAKAAADAQNQPPVVAPPAEAYGEEPPAYERRRRRRR